MIKQGGAFNHGRPLYFSDLPLPTPRSDTHIMNHLLFRRSLSNGYDPVVELLKIKSIQERVEMDVLQYLMEAVNYQLWVHLIRYLMLESSCIKYWSPFLATWENMFTSTMNGVELIAMSMT